MDDILPGRNNTAIIWDNGNHVSENVWAGKDRGTLKTYCGNRRLRSWQLSETQKNLLRMLGFGVFCNTDVVFTNDAALVTALVEKWRPETNTFFMRRGEMTITLEDVGYILGLPIFGQPLCGPEIESPSSYFRENWFEPMTKAEFDRAWYKCGIRYEWLYDRYHESAGDDDMRLVGLRTKAYLLFVIGSVLFPTSTRNVVHPRYISVLQRLVDIPTYAWGPAVLGYLYRGLDSASKKESQGVVGCLLLLQIWSYERFPSIGVPTRISDTLVYPIAESWSYSTKNHILNKFYRL